MIGTRMFRSKFSRKQKKELKEIKSYNLDWQDFYKVNNIESSLAPEEFFILNIDKSNLIVPNVLDIGYYLNAYKDVQLEPINPLIHYMRHGRLEGRESFPSKQKVIPSLSKEQIKHDFCILSEQCIDWASYTQNHSLHSAEEAIAHYVTYWPTLLPKIDNVIDTAFYIEKNPDIWELSENPLVHYLTHGKAEGRQALNEAVELAEEIEHEVLLNESAEFEVKVVKKCDLESKLRALSYNWEHFYEHNEIKSQSLDPVQYLIDNQDTMKINIPKIFDSELYLELYPDIARANITPLRHYFLHGRAEGRVGYFDVQSHFCLGNHQFDNGKALYVIVCHESSATGAPLVGFNLSQQLSKQFNVVNIVLRKNKLQSAFEQECIASISDLHVQSSVLAKKALNFIAKQFKSIDGIVCNSVETAYVLEAANELNIPTVSLVHEFSEYTRPVGKISNTVFYADKVVVPAQVIKDSMCRELQAYRGIKVSPNNITIQPQGRLPFIPEGHGKLDSLETLNTKLGLKSDTNCNVLVGAGYVQIRKGVDLFISAAKRIKELSDKPCKFVWVGEGYSPNTDLNYSNWLQTQLTLNGLEEDVVFLGHQRNLDNVMALTDVFCMTSRLDPFPNVVIDALDADVHVACFEQSTGCAKFLQEHNANATIANYLDIEQFAQGVSQYLNANERLVGKNKSIVTDFLNFDNYTQSVLDELKQAAHFRKSVSSSIEVLERSNRFNASFYNPALSPLQAQKEYVQLGLKGIHLYNPAPGFCERLWLAKEGSPYKVGLVDALINGQHSTHNTYSIQPETNGELIKYRYAVHLHLFYPDLADEFASYFKQLPKGFDIFITHLDKQDTDVIKETFSQCGANNIHLIIVENKGRDVAPFIDVLKSHIDADIYTVVGHFHSKKSLEVGGDMGDRWRRFLLDTLIGNKQQATQVLAQFNDSEIGLVFAEDRHCVDSGDNISFIETLYEKMDINADPDCYLFPLGTMFWARSEAIKPLFSLPKALYTPDEPLPYDGSYLHAIERVLPFISEKQHFSSLSIYSSNYKW